MNRQTQSAVLFLLGATMLHAGSTDLYLRYVKAGLQPLLLAAGVVLIVAAGATWWYERRERAGVGDDDTGVAARPDDTDAGANPDTTPDSDPDAGSGTNPGTNLRTHPEAAPDAGPVGNPDAEPGTPDAPGADPHVHTHPEPRVAWLLILPLLALILVAPPALGSYSANRTGTALQEPVAYGKLPATGELKLALVDYAGRAVYDKGRTLRGRSVQVAGFVALGADGTPYLVRMALSCCAADAQPVKVALEGAIPPVLQPDTWLLVTGSYSARQVKDPVNDGPIPFLHVTSARPMAEPKDPYDETWNT